VFIVSDNEPISVPQFHIPLLELLDTIIPLLQATKSDDVVISNVSQSMNNVSGSGNSNISNNNNSSGGTVPVNKSIAAPNMALQPTPIPPLAPSASFGAQGVIAREVQLVVIDAAGLLSVSGGPGSAGGSGGKKERHILERRAATGITLNVLYFLIV
jgi:hypothetical protein